MLLGQNFQEQEKDLASKIDAYMAPLIEMKDFSGTIVIGSKEKTLYEGAFGYADIEKKIPNNLDTRFPILQISQPFTAALALMLEQEGLFDLDIPINKIVPNLHPAGNSISIRHLMTHSSGIPDYWEMNGVKNPPAQGLNRSAINQWIADQPLYFEPGSEYSFSHTNYILLPQILEVVAGRPFERSIRAKVLRNVKDTEISFVYPQPDSVVIARGHDPGFGESRLSQVTFPRAAFLPGSSMLSSSAGDLMQWQRAFWNKWPFNTLIDKHRYGWEKKRIDGSLCFQLGSKIPGYVSSLSFYPKEDISIIVLGNIQSEAIQMIARDLAAIVLEKPYSIPKNRSSLVLAPNKAEEYKGKFAVFQDYLLFLKEEENNLYLKDMFGPWLPLEPMAPDTFFFRQLYAPVIFQRDSTGVINQLLWEGKYPCEKVN